MILKTPNGPSVQLFFLTSDMARLLSRESVPFANVTNLTTYHQKITFGEIAQIARLQYIVAKELGVMMLDPDLYFKKDYEGGMVKDAFNKFSGETLSGLVNECTCFSYLNAGANVLLVAFHNDEEKLPGWVCANAKTFSGVLLESIFAVHGYMESHFGKLVEPGLGEISLAEVYKLLGLQNP